MRQREAEGGRGRQREAGELRWINWINITLLLTQCDRAIPFYIHDGVTQVRLKREVLDEDARAGRDGLLGGGLTGEQWCEWELCSSKCE